MKIKDFIVSFIVLYVMLRLDVSSLDAQDCSEAWLQEAKFQLDTFIISYRPQTGLNYSDSINSKIKSYRLEDCEATYWINYYRAELLELNNRHQEALDIYYTLSSTAKELQKWDLFVSIQISIARVMETINRGDDCLRHLKMAKEYIDHKQLLNLYAFYGVRMSSYQRIFNSKDSAYFYAQQAVDYGIKYNAPRQIADGYYLLGILTSNIDTSYYLLQQSYKQFLLNKNYNGATSMAKNIQNKIKNTKFSNQSPAWLDTISKYIVLIKEHNYTYHYLLNKYYEEISDRYFFKNNLDSAYYYLKLSKEHMKQSDINVNQTEISQAEIDNITSTERFKAEALTRQTKFQKILLSILVLGLISALIVAYNLNSKKIKIEKQRTLIQNQNEELAHSFQRQSILLSEIHHRVKNNLQLVISLLTLHFNKVKDNKEYQYLEDISNKVRSIALIHEHLYHTEQFEKIELKSYLKDLLEHYLALHTSDTEFAYEIIEDQAIHLNLETVMPIGIICTELISNSLKYGRRPDQMLKLEFKLQSLESKYILKFHDNGIETNRKFTDQIKSGMGTLLIDSMVRQLQAQSSPTINGTASFNLVFQEKIISKV